MTDPTAVTPAQLHQELDWIVRRLVSVEAQRRTTRPGSQYPESSIAEEWKSGAPQIVATILASIT